jgi:hypothetical protein
MGVESHFVSSGEEEDQAHPEPLARGFERLHFVHCGESGAIFYGPT